MRIQKVILVVFLDFNVPNLKYVLPNKTNLSGILACDFRK